MHAVEAHGISPSSAGFRGESQRPTSIWERRRTDSLRCVGARTWTSTRVDRRAAGMMVAGVLTANLSPLLAVSFADELGFGIERAGVLVRRARWSCGLSVLAMIPLLPRLDRRIVGSVGACRGRVFGADRLHHDIHRRPGAADPDGPGRRTSFASANSARVFPAAERAFSIVTITWMVVGSALLALGPKLHDTWRRQVFIRHRDRGAVVRGVHLPDHRTCGRLPAAPEAADDAISRTEQDDRRASRGWLTAAASSSGQSPSFSSPTRSFGPTPNPWACMPGCHRSRRGRFWGVPTDRGHRNGNHTAFGVTAYKMRIIVPAGVALGVGGLLVGISATPAPYIGGLVAMFVAFYRLVPLLLALAAELDRNSGRFVVLISAVTLIAGGSAPALGGRIVGVAHDWTRPASFPSCADRSYPDAAATGPTGSSCGLRSRGVRNRPFIIVRSIRVAAMRVRLHLEQIVGQHHQGRRVFRARSTRQDGRAAAAWPR